MTALLEAVDRDRPLLADNQFCEVRYEDLVRDPLGQMQQVYEQLALDDFEHVRPAIQAYADENREYRTNRYELAPEVRDEITRRWGWFAERYGYEQDKETGRQGEGEIE